MDKDLKLYEASILRKIKELVSTAIKKIELKATRKAPQFVSINSQATNGGYGGRVGVMGNDPLAAYIEFGTGLYAVDTLKDYPEWIRDIAWEFYINGEGTLQASPYLFPAFLEVEQWLIKELDKLVKSI